METVYCTKLDYRLFYHWQPLWAKPASPVLCLDSESSEWVHLARLRLPPFIPCKINILWSSMKYTS